MLRPYAYHAFRRFRPTTVSLVSFQPGTLSGRDPTELDLTEIAIASRRGIPSCDWQPTAVDRHKACFQTHLAEIGRPTTCSSNGSRKTRPSRLRGAGRFRRCRHCCRSGLASGVSSHCRLGRTVAGFLHVRRPWLPWVSSSLGHSPSRSLASRLTQATSRSTYDGSERRVHGYRGGSARSASSRIPGRYPCRAPDPVLQVSKNRESGLPLTRLPAP
jgi:hypothetical protein